MLFQMDCQDAMQTGGREQPQTRGMRQTQIYFRSCWATMLHLGGFPLFARGMHVSILEREEGSRLVFYSLCFTSHCLLELDSLEFPAGVQRKVTQQRLLGLHFLADCSANVCLCSVVCFWLRAEPLWFTPICPRVCCPSNLSPDSNDCTM